MLTLYTSALMLLITLGPPPPYQNRAAEYSALITGENGKSKLWYFDGSVKRSNRPGPPCETWEFGARIVKITPCQGEVRWPEWNIFFDDKEGYNKITVEGETYIIVIEEDTSSQVLNMEFEKRPSAQGARSLHKYFHHTPSR